MTAAGEISADDARSFAVFARYLNFTQAAEELHISQPALHIKVRKLAGRLGCTLYERRGRRLVLSAEGETVAAFGRSVETQLSAVLSDLAGQAPVPVVLAAGEGTHLYVTAPAVRRLLATGQRLRLLNTDAAGAVRAALEGDADIAVGVVASVPKALRSEVIATYPAVLALPEDHALAGRRVVGLGDLEGEALVVPPPGRALRSTLDVALRRAGVTWVAAVEAEGWPAMLRFVTVGVGLAVVNGCVEAPDGVVLRRLEGLPEVAYTAVFRAEAAERPEVAVVLDAIRRAAP